MFVRQRMTANPFTVTPDDSIPDVMEQMNLHKLHHMPVVKDGGVVGVVSRGDIAEASPSRATTFSAGEVNYLLQKLKVTNVMTRNPTVISPDALLEEAAVIMRDRKFEMLPVVDGGRLVGVITESDILDAFVDLLGFRDHGTRLTIEIQDAPGVLALLGGITAEHHTNITHVAVYRGGTETTLVVLGLNTLNTDAIEADIKANGFKVVYKLQNA